MKSRDATVDADERLRRWLALAAALSLNLGFFLTLDRLLWPHPRTARVRIHPADALQVRLIEVAPPAAEPPEPLETPPAPAAARRPANARPRAKVAADAAAAERRREAPHAEGAVAPVGAPNEPGLQAQFYDRSGQVRMPDAKAAAAETPFPARPVVPSEGNPFVHRNPLPYEPTRFDKYFPSVRETLVGELARKATAQRSGRTPWGTQINCTFMLVIGGCTWGYAPTATIDELKAMRADPPAPKASPPAASSPP